MNLKVWALVVLGGMGVSGLALALGAPIIPAKLAFWESSSESSPGGEWRELARPSPPTAPLGAQPTLPGVCTVLRRRRLACGNAETPAASRASLGAAQSGSRRAGRSRPPWWRVSPVTAPPSTRNVICASTTR